MALKPAKKKEKGIVVSTYVPFDIVCYIDKQQKKLGYNTRSKVIAEILIKFVEEAKYEKQKEDDMISKN